LIKDENLIQVENWDRISAKNFAQVSHFRLILKLLLLRSHLFIVVLKRNIPKKKVKWFYGAL